MVHVIQLILAVYLELWTNFHLFDMYYFQIRAEPGFMFSSQLYWDRDYSIVFDAIKVLPGIICGIVILTACGIVLHMFS